MQCPRCQLVFTSAGPASVAVTAAAPSARSNPPESEDQDLFQEPPPILLLEPPRGRWLTWATMVLLGVNVVVFAAWGYVWFERWQLVVNEVPFFRDGPWNQHFRLSHRVEEAAGLAPWPAILAVVVWSFVMQRNARSLNAAGLIPWSALIIGALCCLPAVVLFYINLQELWRSSDPYEIREPDSWRHVPASWWIRAWGLLALSVPIFIFLGFQFGKAGREFDRVLDWLALAANFNAVLGLILLMVIMEIIGRRQQQRYIRLHDEAN